MSEPGFLDTHLHLIHRDRAGYGWTDGIPALATGDFTLPDFRDLAPDVGPAIFMEAGADDATYRDEARYIAGLVRDGRLLGQIASCRPETDDGFDAWLDECEGLGVVGFRRILHVVPDELSQTDTFRRNLRKIGARGLPMDLCFLGRQLGIAAELVRACDGQVFVLDHCGTPDIAGGDFDRWARGITALAALPNVHVKLSGLTAYEGPHATADSLRPWVDHVIDRFGPARMVWGSDWPVVNLGTGVAAWTAITRDLIGRLSADEQRAVMSENARRLWRV